MGTSDVVSTIARFRSSAVVSTSTSSSLRNSSERCTSVSSSTGRVDVGRRRFLGGLIAAGVGGVYGGSAGGEEMAPPEVGLQEGRLRGCDGRPPCVSTSAFQSPSRFMPPWTVSRWSPLSPCLAVSRYCEIEVRHCAPQNGVKSEMWKLSLGFSAEPTRHWFYILTISESHLHFLFLGLCEGG